MSNELKIVPLEQPAWDVIGGGINDYNIQKAGPDNSQNLCFVLQNSEGETVGGIIGATFWTWFSINLMWIQEEYRSKGYGHQLLLTAEEEARKRGAKNAHLDTLSFQAPDFYKKHGYQVFGKLDHFPEGHTRYFLKKDL
ncbi:GNAT family N-acetyltransferase [Chloroflexota bacterium]